MQGIAQIFYNALLNLGPLQILIFSLFLGICVLMSCVYKLASNHINHLTMAIDNLNNTLSSQGKDIVSSIKASDSHSREEHTKMIEVLNRLLGRTE